MRDKISQMRLESLHPKARLDFKQFIEDAEEGLNITLRISQALRTMDEQQSLYDLGRKKAGSIVTNAKPGSSYHNYGLAVDLVVMVNDKLDWNYDMGKLLPYAIKHGISWGGNWKKFKDKPHFEKTFGINWKEMLDKYQKKDFISGTKYINL
jgi:hypothetical protein